MQPEEALDLVDEILHAHTGSPLTGVQRLIFRESLDGRSYEEMDGYATQHIKNEDLRLWRILSEALNKEVRKSNVQEIFEIELETRDGYGILHLIEQAVRAKWIKLDLSGKGLKELPPEIGRLTDLEELVLDSMPTQHPGKSSRMKYNEIQKLPSEIGKLTKLQNLSIRGNRLINLPQSIEGLVNLEVLNISGNSLTSLPETIGQLFKLKSLDASSNKLANVPDTIQHTTALKSLKLNNNALTRFPDVILKLKSLECLALSNNEITILPESIGQLICLQSLHIRFNQLAFLPSTIGELVNLERFSLSNNSLSKLPDSIGCLVKLKEFYLGNNQLQDLPKSFSNLYNLKILRIGSNNFEIFPEVVTELTNLSALDLDLNRISSLPDSISKMNSLREMSISFNELSSMPEAIGNLTNLIELSFANNGLKNLPKAIGNLNNLRELSLRENKIVRLPETLISLNFRNLRTLDLTGNLLERIPPEVEQKGIQAIVSYYLQLQQEQSKPLNEAKLLIVGQGSVGKTSLMRQLLGKSFNPSEHKTEGINIESWNISFNNQIVQLNMWDFGGQEIMHATHQFFLTKRSLYLLVLDSRIGEEENRIEYWLKLIQSFGEGSPVVIVGNKCDEHPLDIDRRGLQAKYSNIKAFIETSCLEGRGIEILKTTIQGLISDALTESGSTEESPLKHIRDVLPLSWFNVKTRLRDMSQDFISYESYVQICQAEGIAEDFNHSTLIRLLHDLGIVLNFREDPRLEDTNILNPEWVTNGVYRILNDNLLMTEFKGILDLSYLNRILESRRYPRRKHPFLIDLMQRFELCFDMDREKFLVPDLLPKEEPYTGNWQNSLSFEYHYPVLPGSIISRFIVRMNDKIYQRTYWRNGVILAYENNVALIKADREDRRIIIRIQSRENVRNDCRHFLTAIRSQFDAIHKTIPGLEIEQKVPLPGHPNILLDYRNLLDYEEMGEPVIIPPGIKERINVKVLLDGIEFEPDRQRRKNDSTTLKNESNHYYTFIAGDQVTDMSDNYTNNLQGSNIANVANVLKDNARQQANQHVHTSEQRKTLAESASEIQQLLKQLEQTNPTAIEAEKVAYVNDETTPKFKRRVVSALQAGGEAAIEEFFDNPYVNVGKAIVKGWIEAE
jgi:internalin A